MEVQIISFGKIAEFIPKQSIKLTNTVDTDGLKLYLENNFTDLAGTKYKLALNQHIVQANLPLKDHDVIAIMPPFSGG